MKITMKELIAKMICPQCGGGGELSSSIVCPTCGGGGELTAQQREAGSKREFDVKVKDYYFHAVSNDETEARNYIYNLIQRKRGLFKDYVNVKPSEYVVTERKVAQSDDIKKGRERIKKELDKLKSRVKAKGYVENLGYGKEESAVKAYLDSLNLSYSDNHKLMKEYWDGLQAI